MLATQVVPAVPTGAFFETAVNCRVEILTNQVRITSQGKAEPDLIWLGSIAKLGREAEPVGERVRHRVRIFGRSPYDGSLERLVEFTWHDAKAASAFFDALLKAVRDWRALHQDVLAFSLTADDKDFRGQSVWIEGEHVGFSWNDAPFFVRLPDAGSGPIEKRTVRQEAQRRKWQEQQDREWNELKKFFRAFKSQGVFSDGEHVGCTFAKCLAAWYCDSISRGGGGFRNGTPRGGKFFSGTH